MFRQKSPNLHGVGLLLIVIVPKKLHSRYISMMKQLDAQFSQDLQRWARSATRLAIRTRQLIVP